MKKDNQKLNDGCIKIFKLIKLLYEDKADYQSVIDIFIDDFNEDQTTNNIQVVLNKYLNTLKVFGLNVVKENNKFILKNGLYSIPFSNDDLISIGILTKLSENFPDKDISQNIRKLLQELNFRMDERHKNKLKNISKNYNFSFFYSNLEEKIDYCKQICKENFVVVIIYLKNNEEVKCKCTPKEIIYEPEGVFLKVYDPISHENINIPITNILTISKQPQIANSTELTTTVVYKLKNRLAKTYKIKENEYSDGYDKDGNLTIVNKNEPFDILLKRLMRYSFNCEIISPKHLRIKMLEQINKTLEQYKDEN
mgnify:FL=1